MDEKQEERMERKKRRSAATLSPFIIKQTWPLTKKSTRRKQCHQDKEEKVREVKEKGRVRIKVMQEREKKYL